MQDRKISLTSSEASSRCELPKAALVAFRKQDHAGMKEREMAPMVLRGRVQVDDALPGETLWWQAWSWTENKVPVRAAVLSMRRGHPRYIKLATRAHVLFCRYAELGPRIHWPNKAGSDLANGLALLSRRCRSRAFHHPVVVKRVVIQ